MPKMARGYVLTIPRQQCAGVFRAHPILVGFPVPNAWRATHILDAINPPRPEGLSGKVEAHGLPAKECA